MTLLTDPMGAWLWRATWQSAVLVGLVMLVQWTFRRRLEPRWRHALWFVVMLRLVIPVSPSSGWSLFNLIQSEPVEIASQRSRTGYGNVNRRIAPANPVPTKVDIEPVDAPIAIESTEDPHKAALVTMTASYAEPHQYASAWNGSVPSWGVFVPISIWMLGVVAFAVHLAFVAGRVERKIRRDQLLTDPHVLELLNKCQREMAIATPIAVLETGLVQSPALYGFLRPRLLLPTGLIARFSRAELRFVFLHELAHVKRHDIALNWLVAALQAIHWFNPLVWFAFNRMRADRELACDALALRYLRGEERKPYGETILKLLDGFTARSPMPGLVGILENGAEIKGRIRMIAAFKPATRWSLLAMLLIGALAIVGLTDAQTTSKAPNPPTLATNAIAGAGSAPRFTPGPDRHVRGKVVDARTGLPLTKFRITPGIELNGSFQLSQAFMHSIKDFSNPDGTFSLTFNSGQNSRLEANAIEVSADGYASASQKLPEPVDGIAQVSFELNQGAPPLVGVVITPDGRTAPGVDLIIVDPQRGRGIPGFTPARFINGHLRESSPTSPVHTTGLAGKFTFRSPPERGQILAAGEKGFASVSLDEVRAMGRVVLKPYGRIEGVLQVAGAPTGRQGLTLSLQNLDFSTDLPGNQVTTEEDGRFTFAMVPPGQGSLMRLIPTSPRSASYKAVTEVTIESGQTNRLHLVVTDAVLQGQAIFEPPLPSDTEVTIIATILQSPPQLPVGLSYEEIRTYTQSPEWQAKSKINTAMQVPVGEDGKFVFNAVSPGEHRISVEAYKYKGRPQDPWIYRPPGIAKLAQGEAAITVPANATPLLPINAGQVVLKLVDSQSMAALNVPNTNGQAFAEQSLRANNTTAGSAEPKLGQASLSDAGKVGSLLKAWKVQVRVVDTGTGQPVTKIRAGIGRSYDDAAAQFSVDSRGVRDYADPSGVFSIDLIDKDSNTILVMADNCDDQYQTFEGTADGLVRLISKLKPATSFEGIVATPEGQPVAGASVLVTGTTGWNVARLTSGHLEPSPASPRTTIATTDNSGRFKIRSPREAGIINAASPEGFASVPMDEVRASGRIVLRPNGRIQGVLRIAGKPTAGVGLHVTMGSTGISLNPKTSTVTTDVEGRFVFESVPSGEPSIVRWVPINGTFISSHRTEVTVKPGETTQVALGDSGVELHGNIRFATPLSPDKEVVITASLSSILPEFSPPLNADQMRQYRQSAEWKEKAKSFKSYQAVVADDGTFTIDSIPSGNYNLIVSAMAKGSPVISGVPNTLARGSTVVRVPTNALPASPISLDEIVLMPVASQPSR